MRFRTLGLFFIAFCFIASTSLAGEKYQIDPTHSHIGFTVRHMLITKVSGKFKEFSGTIDYDEKDITKSSVLVTIKTASIDTESERRDNHLRSADFFDAENFPEITFASKKIEKRGDGYVAVGDLTMRGVTKEIALPFTILGSVKDQRSGTRIGIEASAALNRFDFGVKWDRKLDNGGLVVSEQVELILAVGATTAQQ